MKKVEIRVTLTENDDETKVLEIYDNADFKDYSTICNLLLENKDDNKVKAFIAVLRTIIKIID